ncbi:MAG: aminotransferase class IV [Cyanobacteria bacterium J06623_4]
MFWYDGRLYESTDEKGFDGDQVVEDAGEMAGAVQFRKLMGGPGLRFGATVFTTLRVYEQCLDHPMTQWVAHCDRLLHSATAFRWMLPDWTNLRSGAQQLQHHYPVLRMALFPDGKVWIAGRQLPEQLAQQQREGVACWLAPPDYGRSLPIHKTGNYLACWLARQQAQRVGASEAILTSAQGEWLETASGNLWGWADGRWWTPLTNQCLPGLMRARLQKLVTESGRVVTGEPWTRSVLKGFDAIAYSNCVVELVPIHTIFDGQTTLKYDAQHASLKALQRALQQQIAQSNFFENCPSKMRTADDS